MKLILAEPILAKLSFGKQILEDLTSQELILIKQILQEQVSTEPISEKHISQAANS